MQYLQLLIFVLSSMRHCWIYFYFLTIENNAHPPCQHETESSTAFCRKTTGCPLEFSCLESRPTTRMKSNAPGQLFLIVVFLHFLLNCQNWNWQQVHAVQLTSQFLSKISFFVGCQPLNQLFHFPKIGTGVQDQWFIFYSFQWD